MLDDIVRFKLHVQKSLEEYEQFIADEVERSCEEQDLLAAEEEHDDEEHGVFEREAEAEMRGDEDMLDA